MPTQTELRYCEGWFSEERHLSHPFRWMGSESRCTIRGLPGSGKGVLRITGGIWSNQAVPPVLSVFSNGQPVGARTVSADVGHCLFVLDLSEHLEIRFSLDRTFSVPGDGRALGLMVRSIEILPFDGLEEAVDDEGWFEWEDYEYFPFRWMGAAARMLVPPALRGRGGFAELPIAACCKDGEQTLTVSDGQQVLSALRLLEGWHVYDLPLVGEVRGDDGREPLWLEFRLDHLSPPESHPDDPRPLGVRVGPLEVHDDRRRLEYVSRFHAAAAGRPPTPCSHSTRPGDEADEEVFGADVGAPDDFEVGTYLGLPAVGDGWFGIEHDDRGRFRWMGQEGHLRVTQGMREGGRYCVIPMFSSFRNLSQEVTVLADGAVLETFPLLKAWNLYSLDLPALPGGDLILTLRLNKIPPAASHETDPRPVGIRVGDITLHDDAARHERQRFMNANAVKNQQELQEGATTLTSFPLMLGIDLYGRCNIKPACVYCLWDPMKALEGEQVDALVDDRTLEGYGDFVRGARQLVNCSFGEPLLHPRLEQVLDFITANGKVAELSSNGQAFTPRTIRALEGKPIHLYVSLDSATAGTYARLRNDRWHEILAGLLFLRDARRRGKGWPKLNLVFMPMRANRQDLESYFRLCRLVEADQLVLRPLLYLENPGMVRERGGYRFDYARELLGRDELEEIFDESRRHAATYGVRAISQFDFGKVLTEAIGEGRVR